MKALETDADLRFGHDANPPGEKAHDTNPSGEKVQEVEESPELPPFQDAQSNQYTPAPTQVETPMTSMVDDKAMRALGPALDAVAVQAKVKSFLEGFETAKPFLESNLTLAEIETVLVDGGFSESEQKTTIEFLQTYRRGQSKLQEIAFLLNKPEEPADTGKESGKSADISDDKAKGGPSKEYWQFLAIFL